MFVLAAIDISTVIVTLVGGGFVAGVVALIKVKPEKDAIVVSSAQGALVVQTGTIEALRADVADLRTRMDQMQTRSDDLQLQLDGMRKERDTLAEENSSLRAKVGRLEDENTELRDRVATLEERS